MGETDFRTLVHQGVDSSLYLQMMADRVILAALFDSTTTLGLVRFHAKRTSARLGEILEGLFAKIQAAGLQDVDEAPVGAGFAEEAETELNGLFGE